MSLLSIILHFTTSLRSVARIKSERLNIGELVTDRHVQITKYVREEMPNISHYFDVWHVAKGIQNYYLILYTEM